MFSSILSPRRSSPPPLQPHMGFLFFAAIRLCRDFPKFFALLIYHNISKQCEKLHLTTLYTGVDMDYCFAVREGDTALYSILSRTVGAVPDSVVHAALTYYSTEDVKVTFTDLVMDNLHIIMTVIALVLLIILALLLHSIRAEKKVREEERRVNDLNKRVFFDAFTSVRNKGAFSNHIQELQDRLDYGEPVDFAIGVFDCDNLKTINDQYGHDKGDVYIKATSQMICRVFKEALIKSSRGPVEGFFRQARKSARSRSRATSRAL